MKTLILLIFCFIPLTAYCPESGRNWVEMHHHKINESRQIQLRRLFRAFCAVESSGNWLSYNESENAGGILQIRPVMINEVNRLQDSVKFELRDRWNIERSYKIFAIKMMAHNPELDIKKACQLWNGIKTKKSYINAITSYYINHTIY